MTIPPTGRSWIASISTWILYSRSCRSPQSDTWTESRTTMTPTLTLCYSRRIKSLSLVGFSQTNLGTGGDPVVRSQKPTHARHRREFSDPVSTIGFLSDETSNFVTKLVKSGEESLKKSPWKIQVKNAYTKLIPAVQVHRPSNTNRRTTSETYAEISHTNNYVTVVEDRPMINQSINQYSFNQRHVKTQATTCMTYCWVNVIS